MTIVDQFYEEHLINFRENKSVLLMFCQLSRKLPSLGKESVRAVSTEVGGDGGWVNSEKLKLVALWNVELLCIRLEFTFIGLIVQESVLTATSTNMLWTLLIMRGKLCVVLFQSDAASWRFKKFLS